MGLILPFFPLYLNSLGFDAAMIGLMTGLIALAKVIAPPWTGHILDARSATALQPSGTGPFSKSFYILLTIAFMMQVSHGAYYGFFSLYLAESGYSGGLIANSYGYSVIFYLCSLVALMAIPFTWYLRSSQLPTPAKKIQQAAS